MIKVGEVRRLALSLPGTSEKDHHGIPSFRVGEKIFATVPDNDHIHVMVGQDEVEMAIGAAAAAYEELWWGNRLAGVRVNLAAADRELVAVLVREAWRRKAPRRLLATAVSSARH